MLNQSTLISDYYKFKNKSLKYLKDGKILKSLLCAQYCASTAAKFPFIHSFVDDELEGILDNLSEQIINYKGIVNKNTDPKKVVFYAGQVIDNGALTEQYLNFLISEKYKILLIIPDIRKTEFGLNSYKKFLTNDNVVTFIPKSENLTIKINEIFKEVINFSPSCAFLHFLPNDIIGYCVFTKVKKVHKFYIVHNDHTFWLGKNCSDTFIEYRRFGYKLAISRRKIPARKICILPFYPINNYVKFKGLPLNTKGKVIGISGANLYKYLLDPELRYFKAIKQLLKSNKNFVFCLCGWGIGANRIIKIFEDNDIRDRFIFLGKRLDFFQLIGKCDILFESYPFKGGLTVLFATEQNKAVIGITNNKNASGSIEDLLNLKDYHEPKNFEEFINEADKLIKQKELREKLATIFSNNKFNKKDFELGLKILLGKKNCNEEVHDLKELELDDEYHLNEYLMLPDSVFSFYKTQLILLKDVLSLKSKLILIAKLLIYGFNKRQLKKIVNKVIAYSY